MEEKRAPSVTERINSCPSPKTLETIKQEIDENRYDLASEQTKRKWRKAIDKRKQALEKIAASREAAKTPTKKEKVRK